MTTVNKFIKINGTIEDIRPFLHDPKSVMARDHNIYQYQPDENWPATGSKLEAGFKTFAFNVDSVFTALDYDPNTMNLVYRAESKNFEPAMWRWTFDENNGQTAVYHSEQGKSAVPGHWPNEIA